MKIETFGQALTILAETLDGVRDRIRDYDEWDLAVRLATLGECFDVIMKGLAEGRTIDSADFPSLTE